MKCILTLEKSYQLSTLFIRYYYKNATQGLLNTCYIVVIILFHGKSFKYSIKNDYGTKLPS